MPAPKHSKAAISNAIAAAQAAGLTPTAIRIGADGSLTIDISRPATGSAVCGDAKASTDASKKPKKWGQARHAA